MSAIWRRNRREPASGDPDEERLLALSRQLREEVVNELSRTLAEALSSLETRVDRLETGAAPQSERLIDVAVRTELEAAAGRIAKLLVAHRRQIDKHLSEEIARTREELRPKVVIRRSERSAQPGDALDRIADDSRAA